MLKCKRGLMTLVSILGIDCSSCTYLCRQLSTSFSDTNASIVNWGQDDTHGGIRLKHFKVFVLVLIYLHLCFDIWLMDMKL